jgi:hypothetical protein
VSTKSPTILSRSLQTSSKNTEADPSLNQNQSLGKKPIEAFYLEPCIKDLLKSADEYWNRREHTHRLAQIYRDCALEDEEVFKSKVLKASREAMQYFEGDIEYFYKYLGRTLP